MRGLVLLALAWASVAQAGTLDQVRVFAGDGHARVLLVMSTAASSTDTRSSPPMGDVPARGIATLGGTQLGPDGERAIEVAHRGVRRLLLATVGDAVQVTVEMDEARAVRAQTLGTSAVLLDLQAEGRGGDPTLPTADQLAAWLDGVSLVRAAGGPPRQRTRIIVDAGHGGWDPGAVGGTGTRESDVALEIARRIALGLERELGAEVILTRDRDVFVPLPDRASRANREDADLFLSVHANAAPVPELWGIETYSLDTASDAGAARVAARENALVREGQGEGDPMLARLVTAGTNRLSRELAGEVQTRTVAHLRGIYGAEQVRDLGAKTALFYVLVSTRMPSILLETSFVTNPADERRLRAPHYQQALADAVVEAVGHWQARQGRPALGRTAVGAANRP